MVVIRQFITREDNFGLLVHDPQSGMTAAIDAPEETAIREALAVNGWRLTDIFVTHDHLDHVEGIPGLKATFACRVTAPRKSKKVPLVDATVGEGDIVTLGSARARVMETPGHCADHVVYWFEQDKTVFVGDTLFALGCGRMFDSTPEAFHASLSKLAALPDDTTVYCGHEYTLSNARFALTVDPTNAELRLRALEIENLRAQGKVTLPTTIGLEKRTNPFLRSAVPAVQQAVGKPGGSPAAVFAELRERKNRF